MGRLVVHGGSKCRDNEHAVVSGTRGILNREIRGCSSLLLVTYAVSVGMLGLAPVAVLHVIAVKCIHCTSWWHEVPKSVHDSDGSFLAEKILS